MSEDAYCLCLMRRALARPDLPNRHLYENRARQLAARLIGGES